jgi:nucleotide-binding universal stress UspA family protein
MSAPVIVGFDGSASALVAVRYGAEEALLRGCDLHLIHAFGWPLIYPPSAAEYEQPGRGPRAAMLNLLTQTARNIERRGLSVHTYVVDGSPGGVLVEASRNAELLVVGHRGLGGFTGLLAGSVGVQVAGHAHCPVVVVRGEAGWRERPIVLGVDGSPGAHAAADAAFAQADRRGAELLVVSCQPPRPGRAGAEAVAAGHDPHLSAVNDVALAVLGTAERFGDVKWRAELMHGDSAPTALMAAADLMRAGLLVVGSRGVGGFRAMVMGSTSRTLIEHAPCPVMVVPPAVYPAVYPA